METLRALDIQRGEQSVREKRKKKKEECEKETMTEEKGKESKPLESETEKQGSESELNKGFASTQIAAACQKKPHCTC